MGASAIEVSILIPSYERPNELRLALTKLSRLIADPRVQVLVVDDGSPSNTIVGVVRTYPGVEYLRTPKNIGLIAARNFGSRHCTGRYIINLDDDSWFLDPDDVFRAVDMMESDDQIAVLALNIKLKDDSTTWPVGRPAREEAFYIGCGNVYRRDVLDLVGPYVEAFWRQGEESERCMRILDAGRKIMSAPGIVVYHDESPICRNPRQKYTFNCVNILRREILRAPAVLMWWGLGRGVIYAVRRSRCVDWDVFRKEMFHATRGFWAMFRRQRKAISVPAYLRWWGLADEAKRLHHRQAVRA